MKKEQDINVENEVPEESQKTYAIQVSQEEAELFPEYQGEDDVIPLEELED
tara:strand:+ start:2415 stop:2567 length:153 start_codon:yes stop_codon:yes gene_type:complete